MSAEETTAITDKEQNISSLKANFCLEPSSRSVSPFVEQLESQTLISQEA